MENTKIAASLVALSKMLLADTEGEVKADTFSEGDFDKTMTAGGRDSYLPDEFNEGMIHLMKFRNILYDINRNENASENIKHLANEIFKKVLKIIPEFTNMVHEEGQEKV